MYFEILKIFVVLVNCVYAQNLSAVAVGTATKSGIGSLLIDQFSSKYDSSSVKIVFYNGKTLDDNVTFSLNKGKEIVNDASFDHNKKTVLYCHGYTESPRKISVRTVVNAYIVRGDHNILILDWESFAGGNYFTDAMPHAFALAPVVARTIIRMYQSGLKVEDFHIVGHSLGGQLVGLIGEFVHSISDKAYRIKRATALDPSSPGFYPTLLSPINRFVAEFVDIIHTDAGVFGAPVSTGSVDFWPNGGRALQPGCPLATYEFLTPASDAEFCSHFRSWQYWAESVSTKNKTFHAVRARAYFFYKFGQYQASPVQAYMGIDANPVLVGNYYLQTNSESPYSRDEGGMKYNGWINGFN